ncbi:MAG TPA: gluconokinase [Thermodesulfobacteriota bacterium]
MVIIIMGVEGTGKTTIGKMLAEKLGWKFYDADDYHPVANIEKMRNGIPLDDEERRPWLNEIRNLINSSLNGNEPSIIACSALKNSYREFLKQSKEQIIFVYLKGDKNTISKRLASRKGHFAGTQLLESQLRTLEEPEGVITADISKRPEVIADSIIEKLELL